MSEPQVKAVANEDQCQLILEVPSQEPIVLMRSRWTGGKDRDALASKQAREINDAIREHGLAGESVEIPAEIPSLPDGVRLLLVSNHDVDTDAANEFCEALGLDNDRARVLIVPEGVEVDLADFQVEEESSTEDTE